MRRSFLFFALFFSSLLFLSGCYTHFSVETRERIHESAVVDSAKETVLYQSLVLRSELFPSPYSLYPYPYYLQYNSWYSYPYRYYGNYWGSSWRNNWYFGFYWDMHQFDYWGFPHNKPHIWNPPKWIYPPRTSETFRPPTRTRDNSGERGFDRNRNRNRPNETVKPNGSEQNSSRRQNDPVQNNRKRETIDEGRQKNSPSQRDNTRQGSERSGTERKR